MSKGGNVTKKKMKGRLGQVRKTASKKLSNKDRISMEKVKPPKVLIPEVIDQTADNNRKNDRQEIAWDGTS
ncbi:MAG TPA: hypothetical protein VFG29_05970, partial [Syntrophales bacterium]|nr:hypothetical protein [Syntrophales bacterium]